MNLAFSQTRRLRYLSLASLILLITGCSRTELVYRNADWLLEAYANKTVAASDQQLEQWRPILNASLERHRLELLPLIIGYLDLLERASELPQDVLLTGCLVDAGIYLYERHAQLAVDLAVPLLTKIDNTQVSHLAEYLARDQVDKRKDYLNANPEDQHKARVARFIERTERWTGKLNQAQRQVLDQAVRQIPDISYHWLDYRAQQTDMLLRLLESDSDEALIHKHLSAWWIEFDQRSAAYTRDWLLAKQGFSQFLQQLGSSLTASQQQRLERRIAALRQDLATLQAPEQPAAKLPTAVLCTVSTS